MTNPIGNDVSVSFSTTEQHSFSTLESLARLYRSRVFTETPSLKVSLLPSETCSKLRHVRNEIFFLSSVAGELCQSIMTFEKASSCRNGMAKLFLSLLYTCNMVCEMNLMECIAKKLALNAKKYPAELCRGKSGKYTKYSQHTGITKTEGQSTLDREDSFNPNETFQHLVDRIDKFAKEREWEKYHTPRNIMMALMGEMGELAELFQWMGDETDVKLEDPLFWDKVGQEMADVSIYLMRMAKVSGIDLGETSVEMLQCSHESPTRSKPASYFGSPRSTLTSTVKK